MKLSDYLAQEQRSLKRFAESIGVAKSSAHRYATGTAIPSPDVMTKIVRETGGQVSPADFYDTAPATAAE